MPDRSLPPPEPAIEGEPTRVRPGWPVKSGGRRLDGGRIALAVVAAAGLVLAGFATLKAFDWLYHQPTYLFAPREIRLEPEPPAYIVSGREGILGRVIAGARLPEVLAAPTFDREDLARAFAKYDPWVEAVRGVAWSFPNRVTVGLEYRKPVALVQLAAGAPIVVDRHGVVLPADDCARSMRESLPLITSVTPGRPLDAFPGKGLGPLDEPGWAKFLAACELAAFFAGQGGGADGLRVREIDVQHFMAWTSAELWVHWGAAPGREAPGRPTAGEKWARLKAWLAAHPGRVNVPDPRNPPFLELDEPEPQLKQPQGRR